MHKNKMTKYIFVTGGVVSGLGKGITVASLGRLLKLRGLKVMAQKLDPYMNVDPGTMSPFQHGEVFVTEDGSETDLDLGHYERFMDENLNKYSNLTAGKVYWNVLNRERNGGYLGETVQVIPHITNEIKEFIFKGAKETVADVVITEIGGTIGDIESQPFLEAIRQFPIEVGRNNCLFIHVTLVPYIKGSNEYKSKPTQHSVKELQALGITPNIIVTRSDEPLSKSIKEKIALFCNVKEDCVIENVTLSSLYEVPVMMHKNGLDYVVCRELKLETKNADLGEWEKIKETIETLEKEVTIAIVGKYVKLHDAYLSVVEALSHAGFVYGAKVNIKWVDSENLTEETCPKQLEGCSGILIPGGFGNRAIEGMIHACHYARETDIPYLGICLGMQIAVIEFARNVCLFHAANSREFCEDGRNLVIDLMPDQRGNIPKGGTMRLGSYPCQMEENSRLYEMYGCREVMERHRHRFEFNNEYREIMKMAGLVISGTSPDGTLVEAIELKDKKFFAGVQFHPEFKSRPNRAHPVFKGFISGALSYTDPCGHDSCPKQKGEPQCLM